MDALERLQNADADEASAYPHPTGPVYSAVEAKPWRTGPQWSGFYADLMQLKFGTHAAVKGFASIVTCALAGGGIGVDINYYRALERKGRLLPFGTPGAAYKTPKLLPKTKAMLKAERKHKAEQKASAKAATTRAAREARIRAEIKALVQSAKPAKARG